MSQTVIFGILLLIYYFCMFYVLFKQLTGFKWNLVNVCLLILNCAFLYIMTKKYWAICKAFFSEIANTQFFQNF